MALTQDADGFTHSNDEDEGHFNFNFGHHSVKLSAGNSPCVRAMNVLTRVDADDRAGM